MIDFSPLPWRERGSSSEPGEGSLPIEPRWGGADIALYVGATHDTSFVANTYVNLALMGLHPGFGSKGSHLATVVLEGPSRSTSRSTSTETHR